MVQTTKIKSCLVLFWTKPRFYFGEITRVQATEVLQNSNPIILHQFLSPELFN